MRPVRLEITAFGPFADTEVIEFHKLGDNPLFLINGATGSGKTTILDAICFALYGETTGNERQAREMRCDHAEAGTLTSIELVFDLGGSRYRVWRVPEQERPKSRGDGFTLQKPTAELYQQTDDGKEALLVPSRVSEANRAIIELTGLSAEQFRQVMVLPQGKFRELLLADSEDREKIFRQLFQTQIYSKLERRLKEQANRISRDVKELEQQQLGILTTVDMENTEALDAALAVLKQESGELKEKKLVAEKQYAKSIKDLSQGDQLEQQFMELDAAVKTLAGLLQQQDVVKEKELHKIHAEKANALLPLYDQLNRSKQAASLADEKLAATRVSANKARDEVFKAKAAHKAAEQKRPMLDQHKQKQAMLESYRERSRQLEDARETLKTAGQGLTGARTVHEKWQEVLASKKAALVQLEKDMELLSRKSAGLPQIRNELEQLNQVIILRQKLHQYHTELQKQTDRLTAAEGGLSGAENKLSEQSGQCHKLEQAWQDGQAAILAVQLSPGAECPVCGSRDHPKPAHSDEALPTEDDLKAAGEQEARLREEKDACVKVMLQCQSDIKMVSSRIDETSTELGRQVEPLESQQEQVGALSMAVAELQAAHEQLPEHQQKIATLKEEVAKAEAELEAAREGLSSTGNSMAAAKTDVSNKESELPEAYRNPQQLEVGIEKAVNQVKELEHEIETTRTSYQQADVARASAETELALASDVTESAAKALTQENAQWQTHIQESVFENERAFLGASMEQDALDTLTASIKEYREAVLSANISVEQRQEIVSGKERPDLAALRVSEKQHAEAAGQAETKFHQTSEREKFLKDASRKLQKAMQDKQELEQQYAVVGTLSDVANGSNAHNLSLQRFVLSVLLDDVLVSAGHRLDAMSKGRYQLLRKEGVGDRRSKSGLDLEVEDAYSGKRRPVATLSGGESFMAALSLALGLSDVVQSYAGGIRLDTLFVDEGFGSLDPESLDLAINTLIDLQASGRMVGVISHVPELKERIDIRLDVLADRSGSSTRLIRP